MSKFKIFNDNFYTQQKFENAKSCTWPIEQLIICTINTLLFFYLYIIILYKPCVRVF